MAIEPVDFALARGEHAAQHEGGDAIGMGLRVKQRQRGAPGPSENDEALNAKVAAQTFDILDEIPGRITRELGIGR